MIDGMGKKGEQFIIVLDIARVFTTDDAMLVAEPTPAAEAGAS